MKNAKRMLCIVLILCMLLSFAPAASAADSLPFTDVAKGAWFREAVEYVYENKIMSGTAPDEFSPGVVTTRGMIVTVLHRLAGEPVVAGEDFSDVAPGKYYAAPVAWASSEGIVTGYGDGRFGPDRPISREQLAAILYRYAGSEGRDTSARGELSAFSDSGKISSYAREAMSWAVGEGLISGVGEGRLDPGGSATRAQVAAIFTRFLSSGSGSITADAPGSGYAVLELRVASSAVTALVSTVEACSIEIEVLSEDGEASLYTGSFRLSAGMELEKSTLRTGFAFPENYIITAVLTDDSGAELCDKFVCRRYTQAYREFEALTESDFPASRLLDLVDADDGNFALLREDVLRISALPTAVSEGSFSFDSSALPVGLAKGDKICFTDAAGRYHTVKIASISVAGGTSTLTKDSDVYLSDFYEKIKLSADLLPEEPAAATAFSAGSSGGGARWLDQLEMSSAVSNSFSAPFGSFSHKSSVGGKIELRYGIDDWDFYYEFTAIAGVESELNLEIGPHKKLSEELEIASIPLAGLKDIADIPMEIALSYEVDCNAGFDTGIKLEAAMGMVCSSDGSQKVEHKNITVADTKLEGEVEAKFGLEASVNAALFEDFVKFGIGATGGVGWSARGEVPLAPLPGSASCHACQLCADGECFGFFEVDADLELDLAKGFDAGMLDLDFLHLRWTVTKFYLSLLNEPESVHGGKIAFDMGECPNKQYRASFSTYNNGSEETGIAVTVRREGGLADAGASPWSCYLYPGRYTATAVIESQDAAASFSVEDSPVSIKLSVRDYEVSGTVTDKHSGKTISGAAIVAKNDLDEVVADASSNIAGKYSLLLPAGSYTLCFSAEDYKSQEVLLILGDDEIVNAALEKDAGIVSGTVTDKNTGKVISGAAVKASDSQGKSYSTSTDAQGRYELILPAGESYALFYSAEGYESAESSLNVPNAGEYRKDAALKPLGRQVTIEVTSWGSPRANSTVEIPGIGSYTTGSDGRVTIDLPATVADGSYLIIARTSEYYGNATLRVPGDSFISVDAFMLIH